MTRRDLVEQVRRSACPDRFMYRIDIMTASGLGVLGNPVARGYGAC